MGLDTGKFSLDELWPYKGFVKPIRELATPHLKNIAEMFNDEQKFYYNSEGKPRDPEEIGQLRKRVTLVKQVLGGRESKESTERAANINRRIIDTKILISTLRSRASQLFNQPDTDEYQRVLTHTLSLLIDIQQEFRL